MSTLSAAALLAKCTRALSSVSFFAGKFRGMPGHAVRAVAILVLSSLALPLVLLNGAPPVKAEKRRATAASVRPHNAPPQPFVLPTAEKEREKGSEGEGEKGSEEKGRKGVKEKGRKGVRRRGERE